MKFNEKSSIQSNLIKTLLLKGLISKGILINASHNLSYSHEKKDINYLVSVYEDVVKNLKTVLDNKSFDLDFPPIEPLFVPRKV